MSNDPLETPSWPILIRKDYNAPSIFTPQNLLREARRQKGLPEGQVPEVCVLDPDGDLVDHVLEHRQAHGVDATRFIAPAYGQVFRY